MSRKVNWGETDRIEMTIMIPDWSLDIAPIKGRPTVIAGCAARQRNFRLHSVAHERSGGP